MMSLKYIVSACLAGVACRHDGRHSRDEHVVRLVSAGKAVPACPEQLGGLSTPRPPAQFSGGDGRAVLAGEAEVVDHAGCTVTGSYLRGSVECYRLARTFGARAGILRDRSPACGPRRVYVQGRLRAGRGVAAALLEAEGLRLMTVADLKRRRPGEGEQSR